MRAGSQVVTDRASGEYEPHIRFNLARRRSIENASVLHEGVVARKHGNNHYYPRSLPARYSIEKDRGGTNMFAGSRAQIQDS
jgi:hypothetical protein